MGLRKYVEFWANSCYCCWPQSPSASAVFLHLAMTIAVQGVVGGTILMSDVLHEYIGQFLHQRFRLSV